MQTLNQMLQNKTLNSKKHEEMILSDEKRLAKIKQDPDIQAFLQEYQLEDHSALLLKYYLVFYEFLKDKEYYNKHHKERFSGYRPQLIYYSNIIELIYTPTKEQQKKLQKKSIDDRMQFVEVPESLKKARIDQVYQDNEYKQKAFYAVKRFIEHYSTAPEDVRHGLYISGPFGVGKTYLMAAMSYELAKHGVRTSFVNMPIFIAKLKQSIGVDKHFFNDMMTELSQTPVLILDDIGADAVSSWIRDDILAVILQYRMQEQLPTFFTSNLNMQELEQHLSMTERGKVDILKAKRIMERIRSVSYELFMTGDNLRHK